MPSGTAFAGSRWCIPLAMGSPASTRETSVQPVRPRPRSVPVVATMTPCRSVTRRLARVTNCASRNTGVSA